MATEREDKVNANRAYQNAWIVYVNGLEVPVASVSVSYGVWDIPQAEIVMVPDPTIQRLGAEDRVAVQVFYCDHWIRPQKPEFRLLFDGEIIGWSYVNVQRGRSISFTAVDYIQIFTQLFFFFMSSIDDLAVGALNQSTGVSASSVNTPGFAPLFPYSLFSKGLVQSKAEGSQNIASPLITRPIEYVRNVIVGLTNDLDRRSVPAANFFSPWAQRTKFDRRFVALPYLEEGKTADGQISKGVFPILRAVQADWAITAVAGLTANIGTAGSIWQVFREVLTTLMMELAMIPTAPSVTVDKDLNILGAPPKAPSDTVMNHLASYFVKPQFLFGLPPSCNVFYPSQITQFGYQENYATQPTRMYFNDESWTAYLGINQSNSSSALEAVVRAALTVAHPEEVNLAMRAALQDPSINGKNVLVYPEEFFRGPVVDRRSMPRWFLFLNNAHNQPGVDINDKTLTDEQKQDIARNISPGDTQRNIFRIYAAYEYTKERYARRSAGLSMAFNPYPIPGFPCTVFDRRSTKVDIFAYVMNVRHVLSSRAMQTDISMSYGRTIQEAFSLVRRSVDIENAIITRDRADVARTINEKNTSSVDIPLGMERVGPIAVGPAEPLREVRDTIQNFSRAENFYKALLYQAKPKEADEISSAQERAEIARRANEEEGIIIPTATLESQEVSAVETYLSKKTASFQYQDIIQITSENGKPENIKLQGIDGTTRLRMINVIDKMRVGSATAEDLTFIQGATSLPDLQQQTTTTPEPDPLIAQRLNLLEEETQNSMTLTNLHGNVDISPKDNAATLFDSFEAAMFYNARPICTLDEYITFLGDQAAPAEVRGRVLPNVSLSATDDRTFPAVYYKRIRQYRPGPPRIIPETGVNLSNATVLTSPDGVYVAPLAAAELDLTLRGENIAAFINDPSKVTNKVQGIPDDFPQTSQDWDAILKIYRSNVLSRLAPGT